MLNWKSVVKAILMVLWGLITLAVVVSLPLWVVGVTQGIVLFQWKVVLAYIATFFLLVLSFGLIRSMDASYD